MSQFVVDLNDPEEKESESTGVDERGDDETVVRSRPKPSANPLKQVPRRKFGFWRIALVVLILFAGTAAVVGYFYWQGLRQSPQYSLASLVEAARNGDQKTLDELVDTDAVVENFVPQVIDRAVELYGRNQPPERIAKIRTYAAPLMPAIKERARAEVPRVIREKSDKFAGVPSWAIAIGAAQYLDIKTEGDTAVIVSRIPARPFELTMKRRGERWQVVGIKDDVLATRIAESIGQEIMLLSTKDGINKAVESLGIPNLDKIRKKVEDLFR